MTSTLPVSDRRWYRIGEWLLAAVCVCLLTYGIAVSRGWITGDPPSRSNLLFWGALACQSIGFIARRRSYALAYTFISLTAVLLILSVVALGRGD